MAESKNTVGDIMAAAVRTLHRDTIVANVERFFSEHQISGATLGDELSHSTGYP